MHPIMDDLYDLPIDKKDDFKKIDLSATLVEQIPLIPDSYGVCSTCTQFMLIKTKYGKDYTECEWHKNIVPNTVDPIVFCMSYSPRNQLSLRDMWSVATMIECDKNKIGFDV